MSQHPKHKKVFMLVPSSSAPWGSNQFGQALAYRVNLSDFNFTAIGPVDGLRVGFNAAAGFEKGQTNPGFKFGFSSDVIDFDPNILNNYMPEQRGYAFSIGWFTNQGDLVRAAAEEIYNNTSRVGVFAKTALGTPSPVTTANQNTITERFKTKQEFIIAPAIGTNGHNATQIGIPNMPDWWQDHNAWNTMTERFFKNKTYYDLSFVMDWPYRREDFDKKYAAHVHEPFVDIQPSYNFFVREYEQGVATYDATGDLFPTYLLPNIYMFASELQGGHRDPRSRGANTGISGLSGFEPLPGLSGLTPNRNIVNVPGSTFWKHITLDSKIPTTYIDIVDGMRPVSFGIQPTTDPTIGTRKVGERDIGQHFQKFGEVINSQPVINIPNFHEYQNIIFPRDNLNSLEDLEGREVLFPMNVKVEFATDTKTTFADYLRDAKLTSALIKWIITGSSDPYFDDWAQYAFPADLGSIPASGPGSPIAFDASAIPDAISLQDEYQNPTVYDFGKFVDGVLYLHTANTPTGTLTDEWQSILETNWDGMFLGELTSEVAAASTSQYALFVQLMMYVFKSNVQEFVDQNKRDFKNLLRNDVSSDYPRSGSYSETLLYCLEKTALSSSVNGLTPTLDTQKVWFPNSSDIDIIKYVDTQVKYNTPYQYVINAYQLVIGNKYEYKINELSKRPSWNAPADTGGSNEYNLWQELCLFIEPCLKLVKIPIYDSKFDSPDGIMVLDSHPVPPDVHIIPWRSVDDKILIWLNGNVGDFEDYPQKILPGDWAGYDLNKKIRFKSDDPSTKFEIFKLDYRPRNYGDFANGKRIELGGDGVPAKSYTDTEIKSNKKYYYTFRTTDVHNHSSNPSAIYECELVKTDEFVHLEVRIIDLNEFVDMEIVKPFKKFVQIKPAYSQTILDMDAITEYAGNLLAPPAGSLELTEEQIRGLGNTIRFEDPGQSLWDTGTGRSRKYKIRLHSKKSGRKIDFNIDFTFDTDILSSLGEDES